MGERGGSSYNDLAWLEDAVPVKLNDQVTIFENKHANAARKKGVHSLIDMLDCSFSWDFCKPFSKSRMVTVPEILMYQWYHNVIVLTYYLIKERVERVSLTTLVNVILSDYRFYKFQKEGSFDYLSCKEFKDCIISFTKDTLTSNDLLRLALHEAGKRADCERMYRRNRAMKVLLESNIDKGFVSTKDLIDFIVAYESDDYRPFVALDLFGEAVFSFVSYIVNNGSGSAENHIYYRCVV